VDIQKNTLFGGGGVLTLGLFSLHLDGSASDLEKDNYKDTTKGLVNCVRSDFKQVKQV
jgi:hypothetical protein